MKSIIYLFILLLGSSSLLSAQVFDFVVAKDGSGTHTTVQDAVNDCPDNVRTLIFVKKGTYEEKVMIGSHTKASSQLISLIGEDAENTIITWDDYFGKVVDGKTLGGTDCGTFIVNAVDFYAENITIQNSYTKAQAIALYNVGDRQTFKNCRLIGYQDTHRLRKGRRSYYTDCYIEGAVDYIYSGGTAIYENCQLHTIRDGGYIAAPEDITYFISANGKKYYYEFIFRNCTLTAPENVTYYLGRPWKAECSAVYISCNMQGVKNTGWSTWDANNHLSSFFAEYNSMDMSGNPLDVSNRVDWSYQLTKEEIDTYYTNEKIYSFISGAYDPLPLVVAPETPLNFSLNERFEWDPVENAKGYIILRNDEAVIFTTETSHLYSTALKSSGNTVYTVKAVGQNGNLSLSSNEVTTQETGITNPVLTSKEIYSHNNTLFVPENEKAELYSISGALVNVSYNKRQIDLSNLKPGHYIVKVSSNGNTYAGKIQL